jgi:ATP-dependent Lhr-like helicase
MAVGSQRAAEIVRDERIERKVDVKAILPARLSAFPWFGFSGLKLSSEVVAQIDPAGSTLVFTNTRSQAELWFDRIRRAKPEWGAIMGLHHGSLARENRERVENGARDGSIRVVVATSSLDLGVDFPRVEKVIQIGTVKGFGRALQRAGRAFHRPSEPTALWICPTHLLETVEISAVRDGLANGALEARSPFAKPMDVLTQFLLNSAYGGGFSLSEIRALLQSTTSFKDVSERELGWALDLLTTGGLTLQAYPEFKKLCLIDGRYRFADARLARLHKMNIGTIVSSGGVQVKFARGSALGTVDEAFIAKLAPGEAFSFAGRSLRLERVRDMTAYVRLAEGDKLATPAWDGRLFPMSADLAKGMRFEVDKLARGAAPLSPELIAFQAAARRQGEASRIPRADQLLIERWRAPDGFRLFAYPFAGRALHEGLGHLLAYRLSRSAARSISVSANEHGFELLSPTPLGTDAEIEAALSDRVHLREDVEASLNFPELSKRAFREIARVAGLIQQGRPHERKSARHLQMSSGALFEVFRKYDPGHLLLEQAYQEVRERQLQIERLDHAIGDFSRRQFLFQDVRDLTPFSFPLYVERVRSTLSSERLDDRIARLQARLEG